jgi:hypothetical protein
MEFIVIGLVVLAGLYIAFRPKKEVEIVAPYKVEEPVVEVTPVEVKPAVAKKAPAVKKPAVKKPAVKAKTARKPKAK